MGHREECVQRNKTVLVTKKNLPTAEAVLENKDKDSHVLILKQKKQLLLEKTIALKADMELPQGQTHRSVNGTESRNNPVYLGLTDFQQERQDNSIEKEQSLQVVLGKPTHTPRIKRHSFPAPYIKLIQN